MAETPREVALIRLLLHELRTPLNILAGSLGHLTEGRAGALSPEQERIAARAQRATAELDRLCGQLRAWIAASEEDPGPPATPLGPTLAAAIGAAGARADARVAFDLAGEPPDVLVRAPSPLLESSLQAALDAVARATATGGKVPVSTTVSASAVQLRVGDPGDPAPGSRFDAETIGGLGFSLPVASAVIGAAGGRLWSRFEEGRLSGIGIELPAQVGPG